MPNYTYTDENGHEFDCVLPYDFNDVIICTTCGAEMWRKPPSNVAVNWGGLSPSAMESMSPEIASHMTDLDHKRAEFERIHDEHEKTV